MRLGARKARHLDVSEVMVFGVISCPKPGRRRLCWGSGTGTGAYSFLKEQRDLASCFCIMNEQAQGVFAEGGGYGQGADATSP
jgi:hypothetical protein